MAEAPNNSSSSHCPQIVLDASRATVQGSQTEVELCGVPVTFPYPPYPQQRSYMESVVTACKENKNALLESPTGTGKTLSLLCASLGWLRHHRRTGSEMNYPRIVYSSRTHSQLAQCVRELKKTVYRPVTTTLASRDQYCINAEISKYKGNQLNIACTHMKKASSCPFAKGKKTPKEVLEELMHDVRDIEEFRQYCKANEVCPFYAARDLLPMADLVFLPYNYILDKMYHSMFQQIQYANSVVIFDEAHNALHVAEDAWSFDMSVSWMNKCVTEVQSAVEIKKSLDGGEDKYDDIRTEASAITYDELNYVAYPIKNFINYMQRVADIGKEGVDFPGHELIRFFREGTGYTPIKLKGEKSFSSGLRAASRASGATLPADRLEFSSAVPLLGDDAPDESPKEEEEEEKGLSLTNGTRYMEIMSRCLDVLGKRDSGANLQEWYMDIMEIFYLLSDEQKIKLSVPTLPKDMIKYCIEDFKVVLCDDETEVNDHVPAEKLRKKGETRMLNVYCFNPGYSFDTIAKKRPRTMILTSATLSPMDVTEKEMRCVIPIKRSFGHIVAPDQVLLQIVARGSEEVRFDFSYQNRNNVKQQKELGSLLANVCATTPGGVLIFFTSYAALSKSLDGWKDTYLKEISEHGKRVFREECGAAKNRELVLKYKEEVKAHGGAVFFGVCRGKVAEGLDFAEKEALTAVVVGVPFPSVGSKYVKLKRQYMDQHNGILQLNGQSWYFQEAMRSVNQSIGRTIHRQNGYGAIVLVDHRYSYAYLKDKLAGWMQKSTTVVNSSLECTKNLTAFFARLEAKRDGGPQSTIPSAASSRSKRRYSESTAAMSASASSKSEGTDRVDGLIGLLAQALGENLFGEVMDQFSKYHKGRIKSPQLMAEFTFNCFEEAISKAEERKEEGRRGTIKAALAKTVQLVKSEDREEYEAELVKLLSSGER